MKNKYLEECRKDGGIVLINKTDERGYGVYEYAVENYFRPGTWLNIFKKEISAIKYCERFGLKILKGEKWAHGEYRKVRLLNV